MKQDRAGGARRGLFAATLALTATAALAVVVPQDDAGSRFEFRSPDLYVQQIYEPVGRIPGGEWARGLEALGSPAGSSFVDLRTGRWARLQPATPLVPGAGVGNRLTWERLGVPAPGGERELADAAWRAFENWVIAHAEALRVDPSELVSPGRVTVLTPDHINIWVPRRVAGVTVRGAALTATIRYGNLVLFGADNWGDVDGLGFADLSMEQASAALARQLGLAAPGASWRAAELAWIPVSTLESPALDEVGQGLGYRLAWVLRNDLGLAGRRFEISIDARDGSLLEVADTVQYVATPRKVMGGVYPVSNDGIPPDGTEQAGWPIPFETVTAGSDTYLSDPGGNLPVCIDGSITSHLNGPFVQISDNCGAISLSSAADLNFGVSGGTDCTTPGSGGAGNTHSSRSGFFELNQLKHMARSQLPGNFWLTQVLTANMNINLTCNAFWDGSTVNFYRAGGGCRNTGEIAAIFDHEWGHGMDNNDSVPTISNPGEGIADIYASLRLDTSCIGRGFLAAGNCGGYGNACLACSGVRDIDWDQHVQHAPLTITGILGASCPAQGTRGPCNKETHCEGQIYGQVLWDLWNRDLTGAPSNLGLDHAREIATQLSYRGHSSVSGVYTCTQGSGGCGASTAYQQFLAADDDNGNLSDGTPHMVAIHAAFDRHGIACATPTVQNGGCSGAPSTAPSVTGLARDRGAKLTWGAVSGASSYRIYRTDGVFGCNFGKILLTTTSDLEYSDIGLQNGRQYSYIVMPMGATDECMGVPSTCTQVTPAAGASLTALGDQATFDDFTGDGDPFVDNCEQTHLNLPVANTGTGTLTNVRILSATSPTHPSTAFLSSFPIQVTPSLASCAEASGVLDFAANGLSAGDTFSIEVELTADELAGDSRFATVTTTATEGDFQLFASRQFDFEADPESWDTVAGTFQRDTAGGGAGGSTAYMESSAFLDGQCDIVRSPRLRMSATSTMQFSTNMDVEEFSGQWWDRANVGVYNPATGTRTLVTPSAGRAYNASGIGGTCGTENQAGWAGRTFNSWATSDWNAGALQAATFAGIPTQLQVNYGTDPAVNGYGLRFDRVTVTNAEWQVPDTLPDVCGDTMPFIADFETGDTSQWSSAVP